MTLNTYRVTVGTQTFDMRADLNAALGPVHVRSRAFLRSDDWVTAPFKTGDAKGGMWIAAALCWQYLKGERGRAVKTETMNAIRQIEFFPGDTGSVADDP